MTTLRERVAGERRKLKSVREALTAAVARKSGGDAAFVPFYIAIGDYIETSMGRLHAQDIKMGDMIREKCGTIDDQVKKALSELHERLDGNQEHLRRFSAAKVALQKEGAKALEKFEKVSADYTNYIVSSMGHHGGTTDLAGKLFTQEDWEFMAGITAEETKAEEKLYERVFGALPAAMKDVRPSA